MEILTLQFGPYANFVGTHYWNIQVGCCGLVLCPSLNLIIYQLRMSK